MLLLLDDGICLKDALLYKVLYIIWARDGPGLSHKVAL